MKRKFYTLTVIILTTLTSVFAQGTTDTLSLYPGYSNDVYYNLADGEVANIPRAGWDLAFFTNAFSAGILINEGSGVMLYNYPNGDTSAWSAMDTAGMSLWTPLYNSPTIWEDGAFNVTALGHPDYGWGTYNMVTHSVTGDSLYIIKTNEGNYKKLWIVKKISVDNLYELRFANLDGSDEMNVDLDIKPFVEKNFVYYSMETNTLIDREPSGQWDILFTKYIDLTENMSGEMVPYLVTGATSNINRGANKFTEVGSDFDDWSSMPFDSLKNTIGYDWKSFNMTTFSWEVDDSTAFFMQASGGDVYKLVFTYWAGSGSGVFALNKEMVSATSVDEINTNESGFTVYPNPVTDVFTVSMKDSQFKGNIMLTDMSGRIIKQININGNETISVSELDSGTYFVTVYGDNYKETHKLFVK